MSLINDALKRARQAQQKKNPPGPPPPRPFKPRRKKWDLFLPVLILLFIVTAFFFIGFAMANRTVKNIVAAPEAATNQPVENVIVPAPKTPAQAIGPAAIAVPAPKPTRLQGIAYDPVHPWAIISGKTVYVGDVVDGMRVTAIARNSVTLVGNGQTNTLFVGQ